MIATKQSAHTEKDTGNTIIPNISHPIAWQGKTHKDMNGTEVNKPKTIIPVESTLFNSHLPGPSKRITGSHPVECHYGNNTDKTSTILIQHISCSASTGTTSTYSRVVIQPTKMKSIFLVPFILLYVQSGTAVMTVPTDSELVWLKDVTRNLKTHKRLLVDVDLPHELTFHLKRGSHALTLNLKRNHGIDPNTDIYVVRNWKDSRKFVEKTRNLRNEVYPWA
ncbi:hypothetical protein CHS0354_031623 [Potamilus streckersoni]|uniref:Uncharacterized protein n=1 Tax=Potamilus streckersoni TaxID=2493646 RepID=A0AAE0SGB1_9BIVA|nr:hypothetical protein CHS0354_031623 [Potamilus streckersoni]